MKHILYGVLMTAALILLFHSCAQAREPDPYTKDSIKNPAYVGTLSGSIDVEGIARECREYIPASEGQPHYVVIGGVWYQPLYERIGGA